MLMQYVWLLFGLVVVTRVNAYVLATAATPSSRHLGSRGATALLPDARRPFTSNRRYPLMSAAEGEDAASSMGDAFLMASLAGRVHEVRELEALRTRFEEMPHAWVLVFAPDTDDEAVYSIKLPEFRDHIVVAFEDEDEVRRQSGRLLAQLAPH